MQCTSSSGPALVCFVQFDLEMCFLPTGRAMFHLSSVRLDHTAVRILSDYTEGIRVTTEEYVPRHIRGSFP